MGNHLRVLGESYPMNTNMTGFRCFSENHCEVDDYLRKENIIKRGEWGGGGG